MGCNCQNKQYQAKVVNYNAENGNGTMFFALAFVGLLGAWALMKIFDKDEDDDEDYDDEIEDEEE